MKETRSRVLLKRWQSLIVEDRAIIKAVKKTLPNSRVVTAEHNAKYLAKLLKDTTKELGKPFYLSPYNPAHTNYCFNNEDCCGIFNALNDDLEVVCNECNMKLSDLVDEIYGKPIEGKEGELIYINKFEEMCIESLDPESYEKFEEVKEVLKKTRHLLTQTEIEVAKYDTIRKIVEQLEMCDYEDKGGFLKNNVAFLALKKMSG